MMPEKSLHDESSVRTAGEGSEIFGDISSTQQLIDKYWNEAQRWASENEKRSYQHIDELSGEFKRYRTFMYKHTILMIIGSVAFLAVSTLALWAFWSNYRFAETLFTTTQWHHSSKIVVGLCVVAGALVAVYLLLLSLSEGLLRKDVVTSARLIKQEVIALDGVLQSRLNSDDDQNIGHMPFIFYRAILLFEEIFLEVEIREVRRRVMGQSIVIPACLISVAMVVWVVTALPIRVESIVLVFTAFASATVCLRAYLYRRPERHAVDEMQLSSATNDETGDTAEPAQPDTKTPQSSLSQTHPIDVDHMRAVVRDQFYALARRLNYFARLPVIPSNSSGVTIPTG